MRRLDPKSILILSLEWLRKAVYPMILAVVANSGTFSRSSRVERPIALIVLGIPALFGALAIVGAVVSYFVTRFGITGGSLIIVKRGLWRQERTIPLERIQNVQVTQGLMERLLGIATLKVETASGGGVEASLKSLSVADAEHIKQELLRAHVAADSPESLPVVYKAEFKDIALAGSLQNRALIVTVAILGLFGQGLDDLARSAIELLQRSRVAEAAERQPALAGILTFVALVVFLLVGWLLSILYAVLVYYGFKVVRREQGLQISYGLVNTVQTVIPLKRVQSVQTRATWLFRLFGLHQLFVQTIGGHTTAEGQQVVTGQTLIAPICRPTVLRTLIRLINPALDVDNVRFLASDRYMVTRSVVRQCVFYGSAAAGLGVFGRWLNVTFAIWLGVALALFFVLGIGLSFLAYRRQGYAQTEDVFMVCSGALGQTVTMIPIGNVQAVTLDSDWFQRKRGLVDLTVSTPVSSAFVPCVPAPTAASIKDLLLEQSCGLNRRGL